MRIIYYLPYMRLVRGGIVRAILDWCAALAPRGHGLTIVTADPLNVPAEWQAGRAGLPAVVRVNDPGTGLRRLNADSLRRVGDLLDPQTVLHLHGPWLPSNAQLATVAAARGAPYVLSLHGMLDDWSTRQKPLRKKLYYRLTGRRLLARAACVHCTAEAELEQARPWLEGLGVSTCVLPCLVDLAPFTVDAGADAARQACPAWRPELPLVLFVGRLHPKKGVEVLIAAAAELVRRGIRFQLVVAGDGEPDYVARLRGLVAAGGLTDHVLLAGLVQGAGKVALYQQARVLALPTSQENFGMVLVEALASGTPVITTRGVDTWQELAGAGQAIVPAQPVAFADAIAGLLADGGQRDHLGRRGRDWVLRWLAPERLVAGYEAFYQAALGRAAAAAG